MVPSVRLSFVPPQELDSVVNTFWEKREKVLPVVEFEGAGGLMMRGVESTSGRGLEEQGSESWRPEWDELIKLDDEE